MLSFSGLEVSLLLESLAFILEQAAYFLATGATLAAQLTKLQVSATAIAIFQKVWDNERYVLRRGDSSITLYLITRHVAERRWSGSFGIARWHLVRWKRQTGSFICTWARMILLASSRPLR